MTVQELFEYGLKFFVITQCLLPFFVCVFGALFLYFLQSDTLDRAYRRRQMRRRKKEKW